MDYIMISPQNQNIVSTRKKRDHHPNEYRCVCKCIYIYVITGQLPLLPSTSAASPAPPPTSPPPSPVTIDAWVIFDVRSGTALDAKSSNGACHIPKPTIKTIANTSTATIALGSFTLRISGVSSMYIFLIIQA